MKLPPIDKTIINDKIENGLFVFHRDLRVADNIGLISALEVCHKVYTVFIFTPEQVSSQNQYKSKNAVQFMIECLEDLDADIRKRSGELLLLYGNPMLMVKYLIEALNIHAVFYNKDYSPYSIKRDDEIFDMCMANNVFCIDYPDYYLNEPGTVKTSGGEVYKKYTPFYDEVIHNKVNMPMTASKIGNKLQRLSRSGKHLEHTITLSSAMDRFVVERNHHLLVRGGRKNGIECLRRAVNHQSDYNKKRDLFTYETTYLSSYIKFGCISIREVYHSIDRAYGRSSGIIRELIWRDFFAHVLYGYPEVLKGSYNKAYKHIRWRNSTRDFKKWKDAQTGFPLIDACMRQMNKTGYMHNRGRMLVASFLCKVLLLNWKMGEQYFAQTLTDYDPASNNGNWQSISSTGVDMKPYFRDMNPWIQSQKFDAEAEYIKRWVPELKDVEPEHIHKWNTFCKDDKYKEVKYPKPMVDYFVQKEKMLKMYKNT